MSKQTNRHNWQTWQIEGIISRVYGPCKFFQRLQCACSTQWSKFLWSGRTWGSTAGDTDGKLCSLNHDFIPCYWVMVNYHSMFCDVGACKGRRRKDRKRATRSKNRRWVSSQCRRGGLVTFQTDFFNNAFNNACWNISFFRYLWHQRRHYVNTQIQGLTHDLRISRPTYSVFRLANIVEGKVKQQFDKDGVLFIDEDPKDFVYILR